LIIFLLSGCQLVSKEDNKPLVDIKLAVFQLYASGIVIAADQSAKIDPNVNCFAEAGLRPTLIRRSKGPEIVDALIGGSAEIGTLAVTPQVLQALQGNKLVTFATMQTTNKDIKVIGWRPAGINSGASLKGKRVGYVGGTFGEIFLSRYLDKYGLSRSDISLSSAGPAQLRDLFISKSVDAIIIWEPFVQDLLRDPAVNSKDVFIDVDPTIYTARMNLVARPEVLQQKPQESKQLLQAMLCGERIMRAHPDKTRQVVEQWLNRPAGTLVNVFDEKTFRLELNVPSLLSDLTAESKWAQKAVFNGKGKIPPTFLPFIDPSVLESVDPARVRR
jgi:ABC-type nitrate/sulfonate/bicarbonate transport system substrate-binding protein